MSQPSNQETGPVAIKMAEYDVGYNSPAPRKVILKEVSDKSAHMTWVRSLEERYGMTDVLCSVGYEYEVIKGYSANLNGQALEEIARSPDVEMIVQNNEVKHHAEPPANGNAVEGLGGAELWVVQRNAPWGLARISTQGPWDKRSNPKDLNYLYRAESAVQPTPVDVYVLDTGIYLGHQDFGGRARWGATFGGYPNGDNNGLGTHCAGTIAGARWGAAKGVTLIDVKVLSDKATGRTQDLTAGIEWTIKNVRSTKKASVINFSVGGSPNDALDMWATRAVKEGIHFCASAGNSGVEASESSPGRVDDVITVGATTIGDRRCGFSNYGSDVDIFAPGDAITSAWIGSPSASESLSGTSFAAPHVAGVMAYILYREGKKTHDEMLDRLKALGISGKLENIGEGSPNLLVNNGAPA
ncbi:subtilisin-like serine protease [Ceratobasidium sp. 370]|nr:subtilisin-like serine protease [Ceratobasidium sp. 370]